MTPPHAMRSPEAVSLRLRPSFGLFVPKSPPKYGQNGALKNYKSRPDAPVTKALYAKTTMESCSDTIVPMAKELRAHHPSLAVHSTFRAKVWTKMRPKIDAKAAGVSMAWRLRPQN